MAIPEVEKQDIINALTYIDQNGVPFPHQSTKYELVSEEGKRYPPKYVLAVAAHLAKGTDIQTDSFHAGEAKSFLEGLEFRIDTKLLEKFQLSISAEDVQSTDERFTMDNLNLGDGYKTLSVYLKRGDGTIVRRTYRKGERRNSNQTMARIAFQVFEKQIAALSTEEKEAFPICQYTPGSGVIRGIYPSVEEFRKYRKTIEYSTYYSYALGRMFVIYCWNVFSTILFVQECLKRFGQPGDQFVLTYREKTEKEIKDAKADETFEEELAQEFQESLEPYSSMLIESKNLIFRGAPGTGKTYLARQIAATVVSDGDYSDYELLTDGEKSRVEFVQFHPSYDYTDFVEGLRPKLNEDGSMGFELKDGIFKKFVTRARKNYEDSKKTQEDLEQELSAQEAMSDFFESIQFGVDTFQTVNGSEFSITDVDDFHIYIAIPGNASSNRLTLNLEEVRQMLESGESFEKVKDLTLFFGKTFATQGYSYDFAIYKEILKRKKNPSKVTSKVGKLKKYVFIIDEINRGEISKIFGELFFALDPGYRGRAGEVTTQYANLHADPNEKFFIPENVYIIGTMNDIDRSVDSFDFAMRRRFRFVELKADERLEMLANLEDEELEEEAIRRMTALNKEIAQVEDLNENYQIGPAYFLKLKTLSFDQLWTDYLAPLLQEYVQGMYDEARILQRFAEAYGYPDATEGDGNETAQNQG
ncbi:uncharacterized protein BN452_02199 [Clostridium sp. CAG:1013]|nr:uncharacterized protein BN452_02199 [Clostridium sp. CAG:1013]